MCFLTSKQSVQKNKQMYNNITSNQSIKKKMLSYIQQATDPRLLVYMRQKMPRNLINEKSPIKKKYGVFLSQIGVFLSEIQKRQTLSYY